jgi:very-short-patch-repair endonuclease
MHIASPLLLERMVLGSWVEASSGNVTCGRDGNGMEYNEMLHTVALLGSTQHGAIGRRQLLTKNITSQQLDRLIRRGVLAPEGSQVLIVAGSAPTINRKLVTTALALTTNGLISHTTAACLWGFPGFGIEPIHVIGKRMRSTRKDPLPGVLHEPLKVLGDHSVLLDQVWVTTPCRTLFDLASLRPIGRKRLERAVDSALARHLVCIEDLRTMLKCLARRGRTGTRVMRAIIEERQQDYVPIESGAEARFCELVDRWNLPNFRRQVEFGSNSKWIGRVDFVHPSLPLVVEINSALFHGSLTDRRRDRERYISLKEQGLEVLVLQGDDLFRQSTECHRKLLTAIARVTVDKAVA